MPMPFSLTRKNGLTVLARFHTIHYVGADSTESQAREDARARA
jgi:hypothetical protein